jgi:tetraacyldisaccharide 4'-kinase
VIIVRLRGRWREEILATNWRWLLLPAWLIFRPLVWLRNLSFNLGWRTPQRLSVPVWSVGNLTAGGTGKTPLTRYLARWAIAHGLQPAIISRGYRAENAEANDEARTVSECPVICNPDRVAAGRLAIANGATCLIMDDGFQHRRLHRDLDVVLIDATRPWGVVGGLPGATLPLGYLRENPNALHRANILVLTRSALIEPQLLIQLHQEAHRFRKPVIHVEDQKAALHSLIAGHPPTDIAELNGRAVILVSGLGNPLGFERTAMSYGWQVSASLRFPDHHHYDARDVAVILATANRHQALVVITGKDAVKIQPLISATDAARFRLLEIHGEISSADQELLERMLIATLSVKAASSLK